MIRVVTYTGRSLNRAGRKQGLIITKKKSVFWHQLMEGIYFATAELEILLATIWWVPGVEVGCIPQDLCAEEGTLGLLDDLLVHRRGRVVHDDGTGLVVDLGIDSGVADQVDDPLLTLVLAQTETRGEIPIIGLDI